MQSFYPPRAGFFFVAGTAPFSSIKKGAIQPLLHHCHFAYQNTYLTRALRLRPGSVWLLVLLVALRPVMLS
ncbi:hypothetical protein D3C76_1633550 [compost metagenome]